MVVRGLLERDAELVVGPDRRLTAASVMNKLHPAIASADSAACLSALLAAADPPAP